VRQQTQLFTNKLSIMKVKNFAQKIGIILILYFAFSFLVYISVAFVESEINPFAWTRKNRSDMVFVIYSACSILLPTIFFSIKIEEK
jgi:hypothetical protein